MAERRGAGEVLGLGGVEYAVVDCEGVDLECIRSISPHHVVVAMVQVGFGGRFVVSNPFFEGVGWGADHICSPCLVATSNFRLS